MHDVKVSQAEHSQAVTPLFSPSDTLNAPFKGVVESIASKLRFNANRSGLQPIQPQRLIKAALENNGLLENRKIQIVKSLGGHPKRVEGIPTSSLRALKLGAIKLGQQESVHVQNFGHKVSVGITANQLQVPALIKTQAASNQHVYSTNYHRDDHAPLHHLIKEILEKPDVQTRIRNFIYLTSADHHVFPLLVGSCNVSRRYNLFFKSYLPAGSRGATQFTLAGGVHVLLVPCHDALLEKLPNFGNKTQLESIYHYLSGPPSVSAIKNALCQLSPTHARPSISPAGKAQAADTAPLLKSLSNLNGILPGMRPDTALLAEIACDMAGNLIDLKTHTAQHAASSDIFRQISNYLTGISESHNNFGLCHELLDSIFEEASLLLNLTRPYTETEAHHLQQDIYSNQLPCILNAQRVKLLSRAFTGSGMHAIGSTLEHVISLQRSQNCFHGIMQLTDQSRNYYEIPLLTKELMTDQPSSLILATLNPSAWAANKDPNKMADEVLKTVTQFEANGEPVYFVLDTTIDHANNDLNQIVVRLLEPLEAGKLRIFLCKSYQKYTALGSGKISMGNITELGNLERSTPFSLGEAQSSSDHFRHNNGQFLTHLLRSDRLSAKMIQFASSNARFLSQFCWPITSRDPARYLTALNSGSTAMDDLPFLFRTGNPNHGTLHIMATQGVKSRLTFGFLESSICSIGHIYRINSGVESKERLVEQFFATGQILGRSNFDQQAFEAIEKLTASTNQTWDDFSSEETDSIAALCDIFYTCPKNGTHEETFKFIRQYEANIKASLLLFAYAYDLSGTPCPPGTLERTRALIENGFKGKNAGSSTVSVEAQQSLLESYLSRQFQHIKLNELNHVTETELCKLIKQCSATIRLNLLCNHLKDSFFRTGTNRQKGVYRDAIVEALIKDIRPDLLAQAGQARLMKTSKNNRPVGINLVKTIAARLENRINRPSLLVDLLEDDLLSISPTVKDRETSALARLTSAINIHETLQSKRRPVNIEPTRNDKAVSQSTH